MRQPIIVICIINMSRELPVSVAWQLGGIRGEGGRSPSTTPAQEGHCDPAGRGADPRRGPRGSQGLAFEAMSPCLGAAGRLSGVNTVREGTATQNTEDAKLGSGKRSTRVEPSRSHGVAGRGPELKFQFRIKYVVKKGREGAQHTAERRARAEGPSIQCAER